METKKTSIKKNDVNTKVSKVGRPGKKPNPEIDNINFDFGEDTQIVFKKLVLARKNKINLTQVEIAKIFNMDPGILQRLETGWGKFSNGLSYLLYLNKEHNIDLNSLFDTKTMEIKTQDKSKEIRELTVME